MKIEEIDGILYIDGIDIIKKVSDLSKEADRLKAENQKQKEVIDKAIKIFNECRLLMPHEFDLEEQVNNALDILKEVKND